MDRSIELLDVSGIAHEARWSPRPCPARWGTSCGAWGDAIIDLGNFKAALGEGGIVHFGQDPAIAEFMRLQPFVRDVVYVRPTDQGDYRKRYEYATCTRMDDDPQSWRGIVEGSGVCPFQITPTHLTVERRESPAVHHWPGARLPKSAWDWADQVATQLPDRFYVLHPHSINSSPLEEHWPHWPQAMEYLLAYSPHAYALTGKGWAIGGEHPRLLNLLNDAPDMMAIFALAHRSSGVLTTSNGLAHYCAVAGIPAVVFGNKPLSHPLSYFRRWLTVPGIELVLFEEEAQRFLQTAMRFVG